MKVYYSIPDWNNYNIDYIWSIKTTNSTGGGENYLRSPEYYKCWTTDNSNSLDKEDFKDVWKRILEFGSSSSLKEEDDMSNIVEKLNILK
jgi:hypothetical protein